jgi:hypothetical protein
MREVEILFMYDLTNETFSKHKNPTSKWHKQTKMCRVAPISHTRSHYTRLLGRRLYVKSFLGENKYKMEKLNQKAFHCDGISFLVDVCWFPNFSSAFSEK